MKIVYMGTPDFAVPTLRSLHREGHDLVLAVTQPDRPRGRSREPQPPPVKAAAVELEIPVIQPPHLKQAEAVEAIRQSAPDAIVVVAFGHLLKADLLELPPLGCINGHASLLPRYRGAAPIQWAILNGDDRTGVTTMLMNAGMDTGDILLQRTIPIRPEDTCATLHDQLAPLTADLIIETLQALEQGTIKPRPQDNHRATMAPPLKKEDGRLDFHLNALDLMNRVRAFDPWPGAFTTINGQETKIHRVRARAEAHRAPAGTVITADKNGILVACGQGDLQILELQPPGKKPMSAAQYLAGRKIEPGQIIGKKKE